MANGAEAAVIGAAGAEIAQAIKASGAIIKVEPVDFMTIVNSAESPLVVYCQGGFFSTKFQFLTSYKGLIFYTKSATPITLPVSAEVVTAKKIWIPS
jgi:protein tyrosine phosphatase (PTP) superfamily phosphohydrolase (DUF442 family)